MQNRLMGLAMAVLAAGAWCAPARAAPYWVAWEGNDYPENEGWTRIHYGDDGPSAVRSLSGGVMMLDGLASNQIIDDYRVERFVNPEPGEQFVMQWRMRVNEVVSNPFFPYDPGLNVFSDDDWALTFYLGVDRIRSLHESVIIPFEAGVFHDFEVRTSDMRTYQLAIDGALVHTGIWFEPTFGRSSVEWGDFIFGAASYSEWDYFRFGVVPEPGSCMSLVALLFVTSLSNSKGRVR